MVASPTSDVPHQGLRGPLEVRHVDIRRHDGAEGDYRGDEQVVHKGLPAPAVEG